MKVGILALQGDVREHAAMVKKVGALPIAVRENQDLADIDALIIPGGESTTIGMLLKESGLDLEIKRRHKQGMAIYGTCAGAILLAKQINGSVQPRLGMVNISVERNSYGRQAESFEAKISAPDIGEIDGVFIRAPRIIRILEGAQVLALYNNEPVMVRQDNILLTTFHPELTNDSRVHSYFIKMATEYKKIRDLQREIEKSRVFL